MSRDGMGIFDLLFVVVVVLACLKLVGVIDWSWWAVCSPCWIPALVVGGLVFLAKAFG